MVYGLKENKCLSQVAEVKASYQVTLTSIGAGETKSDIATALKYKATDHVFVTISASENVDVQLNAKASNASITVYCKNTGSASIPTITLNVLVLGYESES